MKHLKAFVSDEEFPLLWNILYGLKTGDLDIDIIFITGGSNTGKETLWRIMTKCCRYSRGSCSEYFHKLSRNNQEYNLRYSTKPNTFHDPNWNGDLVEMCVGHTGKDDEIARVNEVCNYRSKLSKEITFPPRKLYQLGKARDPIKNPAVLLHISDRDFETIPSCLPSSNVFFRLRNKFNLIGDDHPIIKEVLKLLEPWTIIRLLFIGRFERGSAFYKFPKDIIIMLGKYYLKFYKHFGV